MAGSIFGQLFRVVTFGESHGPAVGVVIDGVPPGIALDINDIQNELNRRRPGQSSITTARNEADQAEILSGIFEGKTSGTPLAILIHNKDHQSGDYNHLLNLFRPGHADFTFLKKFGVRDHRGGGRASGRETACRVAAGALAKKILENYGIRTYAYTQSVGNIHATNVDLTVIDKNPVRAADMNVVEEMVRCIEDTQKQGDSIGGIVEAVVKGCPPGLGDPVFDKLDALLAHALMSIGAVKGVEFGDGFMAAKRKGSENNDPFEMRDNAIRQKTNHAGGILGGISTGEDILLRIAVKPTSSIAKEQPTVDRDGKPQVLQVSGRHDPCLCPRIVPVVEAMINLVLMDCCLIQRSIK
ncbi:MAG: chorismate synthase [Candidatus Omnitrophota bacterium]